MQINVSQQLRSSTGTKRDYGIDEVVDIVGDGGDRVQGEVSLTRTGKGILARATMSTEVNLTCSRCLNSFNYALTFRFEEEYFPTLDVISGIPLSLPDEADPFIIDEYHILDLTEAVRQYGLLAIPMKPLCHEGCGGLGVISGHNN